MTLKNCLVYCSRSNVYNKDIQGSTTNIIDSEGSNCVGYSYDDFGTATVYSAKIVSKMKSHTQVLFMIVVLDYII